MVQTAFHLNISRPVEVEQYGDNQNLRSCSNMLASSLPVETLEVINFSSLKYVLPPYDYVKSATKIGLLEGKRKEKRSVQI